MGLRQNLLLEAAKVLLLEQHQQKQTSRGNGASLGGHVRSLVFRNYYCSLTLTGTGSQTKCHPIYVNQNVHETPATENASASVNDATHAGENESGAGLSCLENQHNRLANGVQNANGRLGVIS